MGYVSAARLDDERLIVTRPELVRFGSSTPEDEIDLGPGCFVLTAALAQALRGESQQPITIPDGGEPTPDRDSRVDEKPIGQTAHSNRYRLRVEIDAAQLFRILPALQNLGDRSHRFRTRLEVDAEAEQPWDRAWLRNAVEDHLDEAGVERGVDSE